VIIAHMMEQTDSELGARLRGHRERAGLSQEQLGREIGLDRSAVNRVESGARRLTALELADVARVLDVRMTTFFEDPAPALVAHRSSQGLDTSESQIDGELAKIAVDVEFLQSLGSPFLNFAKIDELQAVRLSVPESNSDVEKLAKKARNLLGFQAAAPILNLTDAVAALGLLAFSKDIGPDTADAGTILLRHGGVSLVNSHMKVGRRRLALAHELGHYLFADDYTIDWRVDGHSSDTPVEARLDRFARSLLLPEGALASKWEEYDGLNDPRVAAVRTASHFRVDMATLARRLQEQDLIDRDVAARVRLARTLRTDIIEFNLNLPIEELSETSVPRPYSLAILALVRNERISRERALELFKGTISEADLPEVRIRRPEKIWDFVS
jgi:Zn-dependent peptidase ImmA (M78 family)/transcriptional regulator with XRE-family HTH domain